MQEELKSSLLSKYTYEYRFLINFVVSIRYINNNNHFGELVDTATPLKMVITYLFIKEVFLKEVSKMGIVVVASTSMHGVQRFCHFLLQCKGIFEGVDVGIPFNGGCFDVLKNDASTTAVLVLHELREIIFRGRSIFRPDIIIIIIIITHLI